MAARRWHIQGVAFIHGGDSRDPRKQRIRNARHGPGALQDGRIGDAADFDAQRRVDPLGLAMPTGAEVRMA